MCCSVMNGPIVSVARELGFEGNSILEGLVVSIFIAGAFFGSIGCGSLADKLGFRRTFQMATVPLILGAMISAQAHSLEEILGGRFLVGLGIGVNTVLVPIYISEVSPTRYRGSLGTFSQIGTCSGIIAALLLGIPSDSDPHWWAFILLYALPVLGELLMFDVLLDFFFRWRTMLYVASLPGILLALGMQFAVDSPRWLYKAGKMDDAKEVIYNLWGPSEVDKAIEEIESVVKSDSSDAAGTWLELLEQPHSRGCIKKLITSLAAVAFVGGSLFLLQQFAGINGVLYFSSLTFKDVGIASSVLPSIFIGIINFAGALSALYLIDKEGRKKLLIGSYVGMALSMFLIAGAISLPLDKEVAHVTSVLGTLMYIYTFAIGAGPVTGMIIPELSSSRTRGKIMGFSLSVHWVCNFLVGLFFLDMVEIFGVAPVYAVFGSVSLLSAVFAYYFTVETKGRSLEEIEMSLKGQK
ncbi:Probable plastidic glucose transporter 1 [Linum perenne]